jgi:hypothetical protein
LGCGRLAALEVFLGEPETELALETFLVLALLDFYDFEMVFLLADDLGADLDLLRCTAFAIKYYLGK